MFFLPPILHDKEYRFLKFIYKKPRGGRYIMKRLRISEREFQDIVNTRLTDYVLCYMNYQDMSLTIAHIKPEGKAAYEAWVTENYRFKTTKKIAISAIIISILALLVSLIPWILELLRLLSML